MRDMQVEKEKSESQTCGYIFLPSGERNEQKMHFSRCSLHSHDVFQRTSWLRFKDNDTQKSVDLICRLVEKSMANYRGVRNGATSKLTKAWLQFDQCICVTLYKFCIVTKF